MSQLLEDKGKSERDSMKEHEMVTERNMVSLVHARSQEVGVSGRHDRDMGWPYAKAQ